MISDSHLDNNKYYHFSGHETFTVKFSWVYRGVRAVQKNREIFRRKDAFAVLGVGKNMVGSIRHWCTAMGLIVREGKDYVVSSLAEQIFGACIEYTSTHSNGDPGYDSYLEDPSTVWLLQWQLCRSPVIASTWYLIFTCCTKNQFSKQDLLRWLRSCSPKTSANTLQRDVEVFLRTYLSFTLGRSPKSPEDLLERPFVDLDLIQQIDGDLFVMYRGRRETLKPAILALAIHDFWRQRTSSQESMAIEQLLYVPGSPGGAFQLSDSELISMLETMNPKFGLRYDETAGRREVVRISTPSSQQLLEWNYSPISVKVP